ncbi:MAG: glycosyltransferase [Flavobacteriales bacterium]
MPRILRLINRFNLGGPTYNAAYLTRYLSSSFETLLVGGQKDENEASSEFILDELGVERELIPEMRRNIDPWKDRTVFKRVRRLIRDFQPDIVHTHASKAGAIGRRAAIKEAVPLVFHTFHGHVFHSYFGKWRTRLYKAIERRLAQNSTRLIALSQDQKEELTRIHHITSPDKVEVVPLGFDLSRFQENMAEKRSRFRARWGLQEGEMAIGILGRLVPVKGHELFLEAFAALKERSSLPVKAFVMGDGDSREALQVRASELGIRSTGPELEDPFAELVFTSWIRDADEVWAGMDIATLTSFNEGTPVSLIEAQAAGRPVVSTRVGGVASIVDDNKSGVLLRDRDPKELMEAWERLIQHEALRHQWGQKGKEQVLDRFSVERLSRDMEQLYYRELEQVPA